MAKHIVPTPEAPVVGEVTLGLGAPPAEVVNPVVATERMIRRSTARVAYGQGEVFPAADGADLVPASVWFGRRQPSPAGAEVVLVDDGKGGDGIIDTPAVPSPPADVQPRRGPGRPRTVSGP